MSTAYTEKQGRYLAYIHAYTTLNGRPPAVADLARYFQVTGPSAQGMVKQLERKGFITKTPGAPRSIQLAIQPSELPCLVCGGHSVRTPVERY